MIVEAPSANNQSILTVSSSKNDTTLVKTTNQASTSASKVSKQSGQFKILFVSHDPTTKYIMPTRLMETAREIADTATAPQSKMVILPCN